MLDVLQGAEVDVGGASHGPGEEGGDLVGGEIGGDEAGGGGNVVAAERRRGVNAGPAQGGAVLGEVAADRRAEHRPLAEEGQRVGDVGPGPAPASLQPVDEEGDVDEVGLLGEDVIAEAPGEDHDRVEGDRTGDCDASHEPKDRG